MGRSVYRKRMLRHIERLEVRHLLAAEPIISEFGASNATTLLDGDGNASDWIELYNAGDESVDLAGWHLTDDQGDLTKWTFSSVSLGPEEFLVVFASGQDDPAYVDAAGNLHTTFRLSREGEYLALVEPDGVTVASEYAPEFPPQFVDVSYGLTNGRETEFVVDIEAPITAFVPTDGSLGTGWTAVDFDDADWISGTTGVAYEQLESGFAERDEFDGPLGPEWAVDIPPDGTSTVTVTADGRLRTDVPAGQDIATDRGLAPLILRELPQQNADFEFTTRVSRVSGNGLSGIVLYDSTTQQSLFSVQYHHQSNFLTKVDIYSGASLVTTKFEFSTTELSVRLARDAAADAWTASFRVNDGEAWEDIVTVIEGGDDLGQISPTHLGLVSRTNTDDYVSEFHYAELTVANELPFYGNLAGLAVGGEMFQINPSVYTRIPFNVDGDPSRFGEMDLSVDYDDGFIAYLNSTEIARRNAPAAATWNSSATDIHGAQAGQLVTEVINVDAFVDQLRTGENVLAIHGLNIAADDKDFYLAPILGAINPEGASSTGYFAAPSPGEFNPDDVSPFGPTISDVGHFPNVPTVDDTVTVTARLSQSTPFPVAGGSVVYRTMYGSESSVPMVDDGTGGDAVAEDGIYTGVIPAGAAQPGEMLRYYVESRDNRANTARNPAIEDTTGTDQSPEYYGTVVADPTVTSDLPILHWFAENENAGSNRSGTRASVFYAGEFYDNIFVRQRGGATNASSQKFNFHDDQPFYVNDELGRVQEFNLNAQGSDPSFIRQTMAYESYSDIGNPSSASFLTRVEVNGSFDRVGVFIEQVDEDLLERYGFDPEGALYKFVQRSNLDPVFNDTITGIEKKTRLEEGLEDVQALVDGLNLPTIEERRAFMFDNLNLPVIMNYLAVRSITQDADDVRKNFYMYRDTNGTGEWSIVPWDKDWTFGVTGDGGTHLKHPFFGDFAHRKQNANQWNKMYDDIFADPVMREMFLRRLRSVMDELLQSGDLGEGEVLRYEARVDEIVDQARGDLSSGAINQANSVKNFFPARRNDLYIEHSIDNLSDGEPELLVDELSDEIRYLVPTDNSLGLSWTEVAAPANIADWQAGQGGFGYEDEPGGYDEFIRTTVRPGDACGECTSIYTRIPFEVTNLGDVRQLVLQLQYDDGYVAYLNGTEVSKSVLLEDPSYDSTPFLGIQHDGTSFNDLDLSRHTGLLTEGTNVLAIHSFNRTSTDADQLITARLWNGSFEVNDDIAGIPHEQVGNPTITFGDIDYSPESANQDEEYIELVNDNTTAVDVSGWRLVGGVEHVFASGTVIPSGGSLYASPDVNAFRARATGPSGGQSLLIQGGYAGHISSLGETIQLIGRDNQVVSTVTTPNDPTNPEQSFLRVSELNYNPSDGGVEFIELVNVHPSETIDASGVTLTQGPSEPFTLPAGTMVPSGGHVLITNNVAAFTARYPNVEPAVVKGPFLGALSNGGERVKLDNASGETLIDFEYRDGGLWPQSADGAGASLVFIDPQNGAGNYSHSFGWRASSNVGGSPGATDPTPISVVINEVLTNTGASAELSDSIELWNASSESVDISGWFLSDSADNLLKFEIPAGSILGSNQFMVFDESDFNPTPDTPSENHFALSGTTGDDVWLVIPDEVGGVQAFVDEVHFGEASHLVALGRVPESSVLVPMGRTTLGAANNQPIVGPLVISEIQYHPGIPSPDAIALERDLDDNDLEFVEIHNASLESIDLSQWRIRGTIDFDFDAEMAIDAGETLVVLSFNPDREGNAEKLAAFRAHYGLSEQTRVAGGYSGSLSDREGRVRLQRREVFAVQPEEIIGYVVQDEVIYADRQSWPPSADGQGDSLQRRSRTSLGNDATQWGAAPATPGTVLVTGQAGDFDGDGSVDANDIDMLYNAINAGLLVTDYDLDESGTVDEGDATRLIENLIGANRGDANLDGIVNSVDLNIVGIHWQRANGAGWASGDFDGDGRVAASDLNAISVHWLTGAAPRAARPPRAALAVEAGAMTSVMSRSESFASQIQFELDDITPQLDDQVTDRPIGRRHRLLSVVRRSLGADSTVNLLAERVDDVFSQPGLWDWR